MKGRVILKTLAVCAVAMVGAQYALCWPLDDADAGAYLGGQIICGPCTGNNGPQDCSGASCSDVYYWDNGETGNSQMEARAHTYCTSSGCTEYKGTSCESKNP
jgi:hypothetical protein